MSTVNIIGSGIMGMLTAHELLKKGYTVTLFDKGQAGQESTWAGGGIISPLFPWRYDDAISQLAALSQSLYSGIIKELNEFSDLDPEYRHSGMLMLDCNDHEKASTWAKQFNAHIEPINNAELKSQFKHLNVTYQHGLWMPQIHQIRNPRFANLTKQSLLNRGVTFYENTPISKVDIKNNRVQSIHSQKSHYHADATVICTGAWTGSFLNECNNEDDTPVKVHPVHGQMLLLKLDKPLFKEIILNHGRYIIPRADGHVLIGSTTEMIGFKKQTTSDVKESLLNYATSVIPQLKTATIAKHWSGLRPGSIKGIPTISAHPRIDNLFINAGHYRNGLVTAPASAKLMQQIICNEKTSLDEMPYKII